MQTAQKPAPAKRTGIRTAASFRKAEARGVLLEGLARAYAKCRPIRREPPK